jgi:AcrR family transcriptional regulator
MPRNARHRDEEYYVMAMRILDASGRDSLTIAELCGRLGVTKGSFYHHFGSLPSFIEGLVGYWKGEHNDRLIALSAAEPDPRARVGVLTGIAVGLPHGAEAAFRAWSLDNPVIAAAQQEIDTARERHLTQSLRLLGLDRSRARRTARMALAILVGSQQLRHPVDRREMLAMFRDFDERILDVRLTSGARVASV